MLSNRYREEREARRRRRRIPRRISNPQSPQYGPASPEYEPASPEYNSEYYRPPSPEYYSSASLDSVQLENSQWENLTGVIELDDNTKKGISKPKKMSKTLRVRKIITKNEKLKMEFKKIKPVFDKIRSIVNKRNILLVDNFKLKNYDTLFTNLGKNLKELNSQFESDENTIEKLVNDNSCDICTEYTEGTAVYIRVCECKGIICKTCQHKIVIANAGLWKCPSCRSVNMV